jgi:hypothetical protein
MDSHDQFQPTDYTTYSTIANLNSLYGISSNTGSSAASQAVLAFDIGTTAQCFSQSDLWVYQQAYGLPRQSMLTKNGGASTSCTLDSCDEGFW